MVLTTMGSPVVHQIRIVGDVAIGNNISYSFPAIPFSGIACGTFSFSPSSSLHGAGVQTVLSVGDLIFVLDETSGDVVDLRVSHTNTPNSTFEVTSLYTADDTWKELRFYLDWLTPANSEILLNDVAQTIVPPTAIPPNVSYTTAALFDGVEDGYRFAQIVLFLQPNDGNDPNITLAEWQKSRIRGINPPFATGRPSIPSKRYQWLLHKKCGLFWDFKDVAGQTVTEVARGATPTVNGVSYVIEDNQNIILGGA